MKRHVVDGAEILRRTPEVPPISPIVAFEHHLRRDGTGYPNGVKRDRLNLCTILCSISDVYDAMRSQRKYQKAQPSDRVRAVLEANDGEQFDKNLVRRFVQLIGIYPPGNIVKLDTNEIGVVLRVYAPDPHRPRVRVVVDRAGQPLERHYEVNLWESTPGGQWPGTVIAPVDPAEFHLDPLTLL